MKAFLHDQNGLSNNASGSDEGRKTCYKMLRFLNFIKERSMSRGQDKGKKKLTIKERQDRKKEKIKNKVRDDSPTETT